VPGTEALLRLPTLFSVGVHDIPSLEGPSTGGWAACTTDEIITTKTKLYDMVVELPQTHNAPAQQRRWPRISTSNGSLVKASQRDVARYKLLHRELFKQRTRSQTAPEAYTDDDEAEPLISRDEVDSRRAEADYNEAYDDSVVEPMTWSRLAYRGFMWWATAGELDAYTTAEREHDRELIGDLADYSQSVETAVIAAFHRQTSSLIQTLSELIEREREGDEADDAGALVIDRTELSRLGLDTWSEADRAFVSEFGMLYLGRRVEVRGNEVDCCGLRVPVF
jgi:hypothetical protein